MDEIHSHHSKTMVETIYKGIIRRQGFVGAKWVLSIHSMRPRYVGEMELSGWNARLCPVTLAWRLSDSRLAEAPMVWEIREALG